VEYLLSSSHTVLELYCTITAQLLHNYNNNYNYNFSGPS
jgi:hypothetical protein